METIKIQPVKIYANDPFDLNLCVRGVIIQLVEMTSNIYEFAYYFTFKRSRKDYAAEFNNPFTMPITDMEFFLDTGDAVVLSCCSVDDTLLALMVELTQRFGIDQEDNLEDPVAQAQSRRFAPLRQVSKKSKSYKRLKINYERSVVDYIAYLYQIAAVITASRYRIPLVLKKQFLLPETVSLRLLNDDDLTVALLKDTIIRLRQNLADFRELAGGKKKCPAGSGMTAI